MPQGDLRTNAIERLQRKIRRANELQDELDRFWKSLEELGASPEIGASPAENVEATALLPYETMPLVEAVAAVVRQDPDRTITKREVRDFLAARGRDLRAPQVGGALYRAKKQGLIHKHGEMHWGANPPPNEPPGDGTETHAKAIVRLLQASKTPLGPKEIADRLLAEGITTNSENFATTVSSQLHSLEKKRLVERVAHGLWSRAVKPVPAVLVGQST